MKEVEDFMVDGTERIGWASSTVTSYRAHLGQLVRFATGRLGRAPTPADIVPDLLQRFDTMKAKGGMKQRPRQTMQACFRSWVHWMAERGTIPLEQYEQVQRMPRVRVNERPRRYYITGAQVRSMMEVCPRIVERHSDKMTYRARLASAVLAVLCYTGARRSAVCSLMLSDVDLLATPPKITFRAGKGRKTHILPLHSEAVKALRRWIDRRPTDSLALFAVPVEHRGGATEAVPMTPQRMVGILREVANLAEIVSTDVLRPHAYRRFAGTNLLRCGASLKVVSEFLGHADLKTTEMYLSCDPGEMMENVERMTLEPGKAAVRVTEKPQRRFKRMSLTR